MTARETKDREQGKTAHGQSLAQKLRWLHVACFLASCSDVDPLIIPPLDPNDVDADGVPNADDLCPEHYDYVQHDEDLDGFGDGCDVCPATPDDQADTGEASSFGFGDGIGDACDPRPSRDGDKRARFDAFATDSSADYTGTGWMIGTDVVRAVSSARWEQPRILQGDGLFAQIQVPLLEWLGPGKVEVEINGAGISVGATCTIFHDRNGDGEDELVAREDNGATARASIGSVSAPFTLTADRVIGRDRKAELRCLFGAQEIRIPLLDEIPSGTVAFSSSQAAIEVSSLSVYTFPINPCFAGATAPHECPDNDTDF